MQIKTTRLFKRLSRQVGPSGCLGRPSRWVMATFWMVRLCDYSLLSVGMKWGWMDLQFVAFRF